MSKRVYKFQSAKYGIRNLEKRRLKVSTISDLNDPFDLCPIDTSNPIISTAADAYIAGIWNNQGILCFSRNWDNLLLWSHYGNSHKGICLGFDISESDADVNKDTDVLYQPNLLQIRHREDLNADFANRIFRTKHECWSYEQEVRMFVGLNDSPDERGLHWVDFEPLLILKEVIIGAQCDPATSKQVEEAMKAYDGAVSCQWAGMRSDAFLLVKQDHPPYWHTTVEQASAP